MLVYILFFSILALGALVNNRQSSRQFLLFVSFLLFLIIGLRSTSVGPDTPGYVEDFLHLSSLSISQVLNLVRKNSEPLYWIISWLPSLISNSYVLYLLVWALFPAAAIYKLFARELDNSKDYLIALIVLFIIGLFSFFVAGIRQTAALSLILFSYPYFREIEPKNILLFYRDKNIRIFFLYIVSAYLIHNSSVLFLIAFAGKMIKPKWWYIFAVLGTFYLGSMIKVSQLTMITSLLFEERFSQYGTSYESELSMSGFYMQCILFIICFLKRNTLIELNKENAFLLNMMLFGLVFQSMTGLIAEMYRVSFFFSMFGMALLPRAMALYRKTAYGTMINISFVILTMVYLFWLAGSALPKYTSSINM